MNESIEKELDGIFNQLKVEEHYVMFLKSVYNRWTNENKDWEEMMDRINDNDIYLDLHKNLTNKHLCLSTIFKHWDDIHRLTCRMGSLLDKMFTEGNIPVDDFKYLGKLVKLSEVFKPYAINKALYRQHLSRARLNLVTHMSISDDDVYDELDIVHAYIRDTLFKFRVRMVLIIILSKTDEHDYGFDLVKHMTLENN